MIQTPILRVLSLMRMNGVRYMLIGGQACVLYGAAEFTRDLDLLVLVDPANTEVLLKTLAELQARPIAIPDFDPALLHRGHAVHFRCEAPGIEGLRIDIMSTMRGVDEFSVLWERRSKITGTEGSIDVLSREDLVRAKKTQRDKDWPMVERLVESDYFEHADKPSEAQRQFWLREGRSAEFLMELAAEYPEQAAAMATQRPAMAAALTGNMEATERALFEEVQAERNADREYWDPLKKELEEFRHAKRRSAN